MDQFEEAVLNYLTGPSHRFVNFQYTIDWDGFRGGSCPDFVVLDFADSTVYIVEITGASNTGRLIRRVLESDKNWLDPLKDHLAQLNETFANWDYHITLFVRREELANAQKPLKKFPHLSVISLDKVVFPWNWEWVGTKPLNRLREPGKERPSLVVPS